MFVLCCIRTARSPLAHRSFIRQAGDGARTRDIKLGRLALYQLSYSRERTAFAPTSHSLAIARLRRATLLSLQPPTNGGGRIRTFVGVSRQIYSLLPLAAWVPHPFPCALRPDAHDAPYRHANETEHPTRADGENRTRNRLITNQVLCQLSYVSVSSDQRTAFLRKTHRITGT